MRKIFILFILFIIPASMISCGRQETPGDETEKADIDLRSYRLGSIGAFAEMVGAGVKKLALSAPMSPAEMDALIGEARRIAEDNHAEIFRETDFLVTDLFPANITQGKHVLLIFRGDTKQAYLNLKAEKQRMVESGEYRGREREAIARRMGRLLSYSDSKINALLAEADEE